MKRIIKYLLSKELGVSCATLFNLINNVSINKKINNIKPYF